MPEDHKDMKKVQCWIPIDTWDKIVSLGYNSPTIAVTKAFEKLLEDPRINPLVSLKDPLESPNIPVLNAKIEALQMVLEEKDKSIERLENDLKKADLREEDLKSMHNNYMLQVQSLINARALMPSRPTEGENHPKPKEGVANLPQALESEKEERLFDMDLEDRPAIKESPDIEHEVKPEVKQEKNTKEFTCLNCGKTFTAARSTRLYCSGACKTAYSRKK